MPHAHEILLVDDNPADAVLVREALGDDSHRTRLTCVTDGEQAITYLRERSKSPTRPDLIILDLNLPRKDGRAVLADVKSDPDLRQTAIVVFSASQSRHDIVKSYELGANCYVCKPGNLHEYLEAVQSIEQFWFGCARLPHGGE